MKRPLLLLSFVTAIFFFSSCKNNNLLSGLAVPKDAAFVFHLNSSSLSSKLSWDEIKKSEWFQTLQRQAAGDATAEKILSNPDASGIDLKSDFVYFISKRGRGGYGMLEGNIKDATAFEATIKAAARNQPVSKDGEWSVLSPDGGTVILWNEKRFAVLNDMPIPNNNPMASKRGGSNAERFGKDSLRFFGKQVMALDGDQTIADDERFQTVMKQAGDMHLWVNTSAFFSDMMGMMSMMKASTLLENNAGGMALNFDDGKINIEFTQFYNKELAKVIDKMKGSDIGAALLNRLPQSNVIGLFAMNFNPQGVKEYAQLLGLDGMANAFLGRMDMTLDELLSATKGDVILSVADLMMKDTTISISTGDGSKPYIYTHSQPDFNVMMAASVNNKATWDKLVGIMRSDSTPGMPINYQVSNDWFVAGNKPATVNAFLVGNTTKQPFADKLAGHNSIFYLDLQQLLKTRFSKDSAAYALQSEAAAVWKDVIATGTTYGKEQSSGKMVVSFIDEKTNSLKQINMFVERMTAAQKRLAASRRMSLEDEYRTEDGIVPPPPPVEVP